MSRTVRWIDRVCRPPRHADVSHRSGDPLGPRRRRRRRCASWRRGRREQGLVLHAHVSEQPKENADCQAAYGVTPVELLDEAGALSERFTAVHATHVDR